MYTSVSSCFFHTFHIIEKCYKKKKKKEIGIFFTHIMLEDFINSDKP